MPDKDKKIIRHPQF